MKTTEAWAREIVDKFSWSSNVMLDGKLVGQQFVVARAIAAAIRKAQAAERHRCAAIAKSEADEAQRLYAYNRKRKNLPAAERRAAAARIAQVIKREIEVAP